VRAGNLVDLAVLAATYILGSINFSILTLRALARPDPRAQHSGNPGVSNVARIAGRGAAALVLSLELGRAVALYHLALSTGGPALVPFGGLSLVTANRFPMWHGLRGGKGVAGYLGFVAAGAPLGACLACVAWLSAYGVTRVTAVASMTMLVVLCASVLRDTSRWDAGCVATLATAALIVLGHVKNFRALCSARSAK
jgi:glycerol-3-phosphate acyltransferase PlsY